MTDYQPKLSRRKRALVPAAIKDAVYVLPLPILRLTVPLLPMGTTPFTPHIRERRVIFIHVPKAAGSSIKMSLYGTKAGGHRRILEFAAYDAQKTREFFKCAFVRNPWDRLLSAYSYLIQGVGATARDRRFARTHLAQHASFNDFVLALADPHYRGTVMRYDHFRPQGYWLCMSRRKGHAMDFIGRFETMEADLNRLSEILGIELATGHRERPSVRPPVREAYTAETWQIVSEIYADDIKLFGY